MGEIFTQRRILGLWILALACAFTSGWLKSLHYGPVGNRPHTLERYTYEIIVIPMTLIAAYLLIIEPKKRKQRKLVESVPLGGRIEPESGGSRNDAWKRK